MVENKFTADDARIVCLQEGRAYESLDSFASEIDTQLRLFPGGSSILEKVAVDYEPVGLVGFVRKLKDSLQRDNLISGEKDGENDDLEWVRGKSFKVNYIGLYVYADEKGNELILYFAPKFIYAEQGVDAENIKNRRADLLDRYDRVLLAIDRYQKDQAKLNASWLENADSRMGLLPLVVMLVRDYLEYGLYTVHYSELEHNGQGAIDWDRTISGEQPFIQSGRPAYIDYWTEQTLSDENNYFTCLHACLLSVWGKKLADWGLAEVLNTSIPSLSEAELDEFGDEDYIRSRIRGELGRQFVTHSRRTLQMIEALVTRTFEAESLDERALSFGMGGVAALWEEAINKVLGSQLDCRICDCCCGAKSETFRESIPYPIWQEVTNGVAGRALKDSNTWRPDFVRVGAAEKSQPVFIILDAKYYSVIWNKWGHLQGEPGIESISKQFFYKKAYERLVNALGIQTIINAFVFPALGKEQDIEKPEVAAKIVWSDREFCRRMFGEGDLHAVKLSGLRLLDSYATYDDDKQDWMAEIIRLCRDDKIMNGEAGGGANGAEKIDGDKDPLPTSCPEGSNHIGETQDTLENTLSDVERTAPSKSFAVEGDNIPNNTGEPVSPIENDCISKAFIRDVMSIPSCSGKEEMMKAYIRRFAEKHGVDVRSDVKGNLYLTKGKPTKDDGYYPCLVNHMDTAQDWQGSFVDLRNRLDVREGVREGHVVLYTEKDGIGADDKLGCAIALALIDKLSVVKAAFFVEEERGMVGSEQLDVDWFKNVGFCLSFDSPGRNRSARKCAGEKLFSDGFFKTVLKPICDSHHITEFNDEPYTDVVQIRQKTLIMCYNVGNGGYNAHQPDEYLIVEDAQSAYRFGYDLLSKIGETRYWFGDDETSGSGTDGSNPLIDPSPPGAVPSAI